MLREWAGYAGNTDSTFVVPVLNDGDYTYSATYKSDSLAGANIVLTKYDKDGHSVWQIFWNGNGNGRDQPSDMVMDSNYIYLSGITYSLANNYDFLLLKISKGNGGIEWSQTYNSAFSSYDVATSIGILDNCVYISGVSFLSATMGDYHTIKYNKENGNVIWQRDFDYASLMDIPFDLSINKDDSTIIITGASQSSFTDWDYQTLIYDSAGTLLSQPRASGSSAGFDRAQAVKNDAAGYIYITGATKGNNGDLDIKTVKLSSSGALIWADTYDSGGDDIGNDLIVDNSGNVYVCGEAKGNGKDFFVRKYDLNRNVLWTKMIDGGDDDIAYKLCFDSNGKVIVTGKGYNPSTSNFDFLTIGFKEDGGEIWRDYFDGPAHGTDEGRNIIADGDGNVFVTGQVEGGGENPTVTIKYRTDYFTEPPTNDPVSSAYLFYPNEGQLTDTNDSLVTDSVHYYMLHHYPQLYFGYGVMNMVFSHVDQDTSTTDTLQRVDVSFLNSTNNTEAYPVGENDSTNYLNYYLGHCPNGITHVNGNEKLVYTDVWEGIDAEYTNNVAGLKLYFIVNPGASNPEEIGLKFDGQSNLSVINNWQLRLGSALGNYDFEKPKVYQIDANNNIVPLSWHLDWNIQNGDEAKFTGWGSYDGGEPLVIEITRAVGPLNTICLGDICWSTYFGGDGGDKFNNITSDQYNNFYVVGETYSTNFPNSNLGIQIFRGGGTDVMAVKFQPNGSINPPNNILWSTYYGGNGGDLGEAVGVTSAGDVYLTGSTNSTNFPTHPFSCIGCSPAPYYQSLLNSTSSFSGPTDAFIVRLSAGGQSNIWSSYFGVDNNEFGYDLMVNQNDELYIIGSTASSQFGQNPFPIFSSTNSDAFNENYYSGSGPNGVGDGFIARFNSNCQQTWCTYFGGTGDDEFVSLAQCGTQIAIIGGTGSSSNAGYSHSQYYLATHDGEFPFNGPIISWYQQYGGGDRDLMVTYFSEQDQLLWSTYYGGNGTENEAVHTRVAAPLHDHYFYVTGTTTSTTAFPFQPDNNSSDEYYQTTLSGTSDVFVAKFDDFDLKYSSAFGGDQYTQSGGIVISPDKSKIYFSGKTASSTPCGTSACQCIVPPTGNFPMCQNTGQYYDDTFNGGGADVFLACLNKDNHLIRSTYLGGGGINITDEGSTALTICNNKLYMVGYSSSPNTSQYPQVNDPTCYFQSSGLANPNNNNDAFITRFDGTVLNEISGIQLARSYVQIFPNPNNGNLSMIMDCNNCMDDEISIFNQLGQKVVSDKLRNFGTSSPFVLDLTFLNNGLYILTRSSAENQEHLKFIIQK